MTQSLHFSGQIVPTTLNISDPQSIAANLDRSADTWILVPGIRSRIPADGTYIQFAKAISTVLDSNVIIMDWSAWAYSNYFCIVTEEVPQLSNHLKFIIEQLGKARIPQTKITLAGYNVGAHIIGVTSRILSKKINNCLCKCFIVAINDFNNIKLIILFLQFWMQPDNITEDQPSVQA